MGTGLPPHMLGGGEKGCRRTREILTEAGYAVVMVDKPVMANGIMRYISMAVKAYAKVIRSLLADRGALLYVAGFYEKNVVLEWLMLTTARLLKHRTVYEARSGRLIKAYSEYGGIYRSLMDSMLKKADALLVQGLEYVDFAERRFHRKAVYTPNYVMNRSLLPYVGDRPMDTIRLVYFGRVAGSKRIDVVLKTAAELNKRGYKTWTTVIGGYQEDYRKELEGLARGLRLHDVAFLGQQKFETIRDELQKAHFFVFPSQEKMEGHSNSLTEAMTFGVVPVVSTAGFNASIVSKPELVVEGIDARRYAGVIERIIREGTWGAYSRFVYARARENYTEDRVRENILGTVAALVQTQMPAKAQAN